VRVLWQNKRMWKVMDRIQPLEDPHDSTQIGGVRYDWWGRKSSPWGNLGYLLLWLEFCEKANLRRSRRALRQHPCLDSCKRCI
jgi:hypothetical protein